MEKNLAIQLLGGTVSAAAHAIGVTPSAVTQWPDSLPQRIADRVQAALWRMQSSKDVKGTTPNAPQAQEQS